jgi:hypothetical protein
MVKISSNEWNAGLDGDCRDKWIGSTDRLATAVQVAEYVARQFGLLETEGDDFMLLLIQHRKQLRDFCVATLAPQPINHLAQRDNGDR